MICKAAAQRRGTAGRGTRSPAMRPRLKPLREQVIVITGASSGVGLATARRAAAAGARLMLVARNEKRLAQIAQELGAAHAVADVGDAAQVQAAADAAVARFGRIDSWVSNAGVAIYARLLETPLDEHERLFRTNYFGAVHSAMAAVPVLARQGGALIFTGSIAGDLPSPILGAYAASKHALAGFVGSLRMELEADGLPVSVTLIKPSGLATPIAHHAAAHLEGEALVPQPAYVPDLAVDAILHAATHPRREMTVGGAGRAQVLLGAHFPALLDRLTPLVEALLVRRGKRTDRRGNLNDPASDGNVRASETPALRSSLHDVAIRHRAAALALAAVAVLGTAMLRRYRR